MISYHFLNQTSDSNFFTNDTGHGAGQLWSGIPDSNSFRQFSVPFPIVTIDSQPAGSNETGYAPLNNTVYEVRPILEISLPASNEGSRLLPSKWDRGIPVFQQ